MKNFTLRSLYQPKDSGKTLQKEMKEKVERVKHISFYFIGFTFCYANTVLILFVYIKDAKMKLRNQTKKQNECLKTSTCDDC